jgi:branched-subunit amino acid aminotransferase/4-amino-4-deoxychorismate lyase
MFENGVISVNGTAFDAAEARIPVMDRSVLYADSVYETIAAFGTKLLCLDQHLRRLRWSATELGMDIPWGDTELKFELEALCAEVPAPKKTVRLMVSRGTGGTLVPGVELKANKMVMVSPSRIEAEKVYSDGVALKRRARAFTRRGPVPKCPGFYPDSIVALQAAQREGFDDALWNNAENEIQEATTANIFFIGRDGDQVEISTPAVSSGLLPGTTRRKILELLANAKIAAHEKVIYTEEIPRFDEAFLCSSIRGLVPIARIDNHKFHSTRKDATFRHIERLFHAWVTAELGLKLDWNTGRKPMPKNQEITQ